MACSFGTAKADCPPRYNCHVIAIIQSLPGYYIRSLTHTNTHTYRSICFGCGNGCPILFNMCCCCCCRQYFKHNFLCSHNFTLSSLINNALSLSLSLALIIVHYHPHRVHKQQQQHITTNPSSSNNHHQWSIQRQGQLHCHSLLTPSICPGWIPCRRLWI